VRSLTRWSSRGQVESCSTAKLPQIINSIYKRKPCFLTTPQWCNIAFDKTGLSFDDCLYTDVLYHMAAFPALLKELRDLDRVTLQRPSNTITPDTAVTINFNNFDSFETFDSLTTFDNFSNDGHSDSCPSLDFSTDNYQCNFDFLNDPYFSNTFHSHHSSNPSPRANLLVKLEKLKDDVCSLGIHLNTNLVNGSAATETRSKEENSPVPTSLHFTNWRVTVAYNCYWSLLILTNKLIMKLLPPYDSAYYGLEAECRTVASEICKTWEDAWASKPIGAFHTGLSFVLAYEFCTHDVQQWILKGLNGLLDHQAVDTFRWSDQVVAMMSGKLSGEGPDLVSRMSKVSKVSK
jgi:hypothetical protein